MKLGALLMPSHPPERAIADGQRWDLEELERLDALGFEEAWIGEHFTAPWEPCPAPDRSWIALGLVPTYPRSHSSSRVLSISRSLASMPAVYILVGTIVQPTSPAGQPGGQDAADIRGATARSG